MEFSDTPLEPRLSHHNFCPGSCDPDGDTAYVWTAGNGTGRGEKKMVLFFFPQFLSNKGTYTSTSPLRWLT